MHDPALTLGLDIGGANLKLASNQGYRNHVPFPLWKYPDRLTATLAKMLGDHADATGRHPTQLGVTMTGELADCYPSRTAGVHRILESVLEVAPIEPRIYSTGCGWLTPDMAADTPLRVAASNWHALAAWIATYIIPDVESAIVLDIGSTTTDIIPIVNQQVATESQTDFDRLKDHELVYTGMRRSAVNSLLHCVTLESHSIPVMAELFATTDDAYLALGLVPENSADNDTADCRPRTRQCALQRLCRLVGEDRETLGEENGLNIARQVIHEQAKRVADAIRSTHRKARRAFPNVSKRLTLAVCGEGRPLLELVREQLPCEHQIIHMSDIVGEEASQIGPAVAITELLPNG